MSVGSGVIRAKSLKSAFATVWLLIAEPFISFGARTVAITVLRFIAVGVAAGILLFVFAAFGVVSVHGSAAMALCLALMFGVPLGMFLGADEKWPLAGLFAALLVGLSVFVGALPILLIFRAYMA